MAARRLVLAAITALAAGVPAATPAAPAFRSCSTATGAQCASVVVPLDRRGAVAGRIRLFVERLPAAVHDAPTLLLLAGGPGQAASAYYRLTSARVALRLRRRYPGYTLATFDVRGTGRSTRLGCDVPPSGDCATRVRFFTTRDNADDVDAVRAALGVDRLAVAGTSYGTKLAVAYAALHPQGVERLLLDSAVPLSWPDPFDRPILRALPGTLDALCAPGCPGGPHLGERLAALANRLHTRPLLDMRAALSSSLEPALGAARLVRVAEEADANPGVAAELPGAVAAAARGNPVPLLLLAGDVREANGADPAVFSADVFLATMCGDGSFPWPAGALYGARLAGLERAERALPPRSAGAFGAWALANDSAAACIAWPTAGRGDPIPDTALPNVPVLVLAGSRDARAPLADAMTVAARFPQAHVLVVPGVGHAVLSTDTSGCAARAVRLWLAGGPVPTECPPVPRLVAPAPPLPGTAPGSPAAARAAVAASVAHAEDELLLVTYEEQGARPAAEPGVYGGEARVDPAHGTVRLVRDELVPGVRVDGALSVRGAGGAFRWRGSVRACGVTLRVAATGAVGSGLPAVRRCA